VNAWQLTLWPVDVAKTAAKKYRKPRLKPTRMGGVRVPLVIDPVAAARKAKSRFGFGGREQSASFVRQALIDRLESAFENPTLRLRDVIGAIETAGFMGECLAKGDQSGFAEHWAELRRLRALIGGLDANELMRSIQIALFPEEFMHDSNIDRRIAAETVAIRGEVGDEVMRHRERRNSLMPPGGGPRLGERQMREYGESLTGEHV